MKYCKTKKEYADSSSQAVCGEKRAKEGQKEGNKEEKGELMLTIRRPTDQMNNR
jgi:hypothetical protein